MISPYLHHIQENKENYKLLDEVAIKYEHYRPGYPDSLYKKIIAVTRLNKKSKIMEIGSGTGKATLYLARRGYEIVCLEKGRRLHEVCTENIRKYPNVLVEYADFHNRKTAAKSFDLVFAGQAFHWLNDNSKYKKTHNILKERGHLATFWNNESIFDGNFNFKISKIYGKYTDKVRYPSRNLETFIPYETEKLRMSGYYKNIQTHLFEWEQVYDWESFIGLLNTYSSFRGLKKNERIAITEDVKRLIKASGNKITVDYITVLFIAEKQVNICE